jgi:hypothetical protein
MLAPMLVPMALLQIHACGPGLESPYGNDAAGPDLESKLDRNANPDKNTSLDKDTSPDKNPSDAPKPDKDPSDGATSDGQKPCTFVKNKTKCKDASAANGMHINVFFRAHLCGGAALKKCPVGKPTAGSTGVCACADGSNENLGSAAVGTSSIHWYTDHPKCIFYGLCPR